MKKIFLFLFCAGLLIASTSNAQVSIAMTNPNGHTLDSISNTTPEGATLKVPGYAATVSIVVPITKISGTVAGTISWQGSNDGTNYYQVSTSTVTDASAVYGFTGTPKYFLYYRPLITLSGGSISYKAFLYATKP